MIIGRFIIGAGGGTTPVNPGPIRAESICMAAFTSRGSGGGGGCGGCIIFMIGPTMSILFAASFKPAPAIIIGMAGIVIMRSEEHTSELQSLRHLVCRLLLEKKK